MSKIRLFLGSYFIVVLLLFLYSFTQIDLGLTLTRVSIWQVIQTSFQYVGYFNRPLSTLIYLIIIGLLFFFYVSFLFLVYKKKISRRYIWIVILVTAGILMFSYNAFSYDLFNYIFDAKIFTFYHQNPYFHKALDYPSEPMLSFMQWTHRTYPYGPVWLGISIPLSFLGLSYFLPTFFIFKAFLASCYLMSCFLIEKISEKTNSNNSIFNLVFFALNPLVIIESLVSSHNDIAMMALSLLGVYLLFINRKYLSLILIIISALVKDVTAVLLVPALLYILNIKKIKISQNFFFTCVIFSIGGFVYVISKMQIQSWYFLWILPFLALLRPNKFLILTTTCFSLGLLLSYCFFLYQGNYNGEVLPHKSEIILASIVAPLIYWLFVFLRNKLKLLF